MESVSKYKPKSENVKKLKDYLSKNVKLIKSNKNIGYIK